MVSVEQDGGAGGETGLEFFVAVVPEEVGVVAGVEGVVGLGVDGFQK